jgi:hypothetical protein
MRACDCAFLFRDASTPCAGARDAFNGSSSDVIRDEACGFVAKCVEQSMTGTVCGAKRQRRTANIQREIFNREVFNREVFCSEMFFTEIFNTEIFNNCMYRTHEHTHTNFIV